MNTQTSFPALSRLALACFLALGLLGFTFEAAGQEPALTIEKQGDSVRLSWPATAPSYSVQGRTLFSTGDWEDITGEILQSGEAFSMLVPLVGDTRFFRLRKPAGLAPLTLAGQTWKLSEPAPGEPNIITTIQFTSATTYDLEVEEHSENGTFTASRNGDVWTVTLAPAPTGEIAGTAIFTFVTTNGGTFIFAGEVVGTFTVAPPTRPAGIYMGNFAGQVDNGGFAAMVRSNGSAVAVGYNTPQEEGLFISSFTVADNGSFSAATAQSGNAAGTFTSSNVNGTFVSSTGGTGGFSGNRKSDTGTHANNAGYYTGTYSGQFQGSAFAILAADGSIFFYTIDNPTSPTADGDGGGFGTINAANSFSGTTVPVGLTISGTLNPTTKVISGSYSMGSTPLGTFSLTRSSTP